MPRISDEWICVYFGLFSLWIINITGVGGDSIRRSPGLKDTSFVSSNGLGDIDPTLDKLDDYDYLLAKNNGDFGIKSAVVIAASKEPEYKGIDTLVLPLYIPKGAVPIRLERIARSGNLKAAPKTQTEAVSDLKASPSTDSILLRRIDNPGGGPRVVSPRTRTPISQRYFWQRHTVQSPKTRRTESISSRRAVKITRDEPTTPPGRWGQRLPSSTSTENVKNIERKDHKTNEETTPTVSNITITTERNVYNQTDATTDLSTPIPSVTISSTTIKEPLATIKSSTTLNPSTTSTPSSTSLKSSTVAKLASTTTSPLSSTTTSANVSKSANIISDSTTSVPTTQSTKSNELKFSIMKSQTRSPEGMNQTLISTSTTEAIPTPKTYRPVKGSRNRLNNPGKKRISLTQRRKNIYKNLTGNNRTQINLDKNSSLNNRRNSTNVERKADERTKRKSVVVLKSVLEIVNPRENPKISEASEKNNITESTTKSSTATSIKKSPTTSKPTTQRPKVSTDTRKYPRITPIIRRRKPINNPLTTSKPTTTSEKSKSFSPITSTPSTTTTIGTTTTTPRNTNVTTTKKFRIENKPKELKAASNVRSREVKKTRLPIATTSTERPFIDQFILNQNPTTGKTPTIFNPRRPIIRKNTAMTDRHTSTIPPTPKARRPFVRFTLSPDSPNPNSDSKRIELYKYNVKNNHTSSISSILRQNSQLPDFFPSHISTTLRTTDHSFNPTTPLTSSSSNPTISSDHILSLNDKVVESLGNITNSIFNGSVENTDVEYIQSQLLLLNKEFESKGVIIIKAEIHNRTINITDNVKLRKINKNLAKKSRPLDRSHTSQKSNDAISSTLSKSTTSPPFNIDNLEYVSSPTTNDYKQSISKPSEISTKTKHSSINTGPSIKSTSSIPTLVTTRTRSTTVSVKPTLNHVPITTHRPSTHPYHLRNTSKDYQLKANVDQTTENIKPTTYNHPFLVVSDNQTITGTKIHQTTEELSEEPSESQYIEGTLEPEGSTGAAFLSHFVYIGSILGIIPVIILAVVFIKRHLRKTDKVLPDHEEHAEGFTPVTHHYPRKSPPSPILPRPDLKLSSEPVKPHRSPWEFPRTDLRLVSVLGEGNFGVVWKAEARNLCGQEDEGGGPTVLVAVKGVKDGAGAKEKQDLIQELTLMKHLGQHPNVVTLLGCCTGQEPHLVIMEYVMWGKLLTFLRDHRSKHNYYNFSSDTEHLTSQDLTEFACQIATGCDYLQARGIIHRDLAARNILVDHKKICKIADFGLARNVKDLGTDIYEQKSRGALPIRWMAPESLYMNIFTHKSDVWSFGILCWEIVTLGSTPYPGLSARDVMRKVREGYRLERPEHCKPELYETVKKCWHQDLNERPSFSELKVELAELFDHQLGYIDLENFPENSYFSMLQNNEEKL